MPEPRRKPRRKTPARSLTIPDADWAIAQEICDRHPHLLSLSAAIRHALRFTNEAEKQSNTKKGNSIC